MVGIEYLNKLKENHDFFDFSEKDFDNLLNTDIGIMGLMDERVYKITPVLSQIVDYAYGSVLYHELQCRSYNDLGINLESPIGDIIDTCKDYVEELLNNLCYHPTVLGYKYLVNGSTMYSEMVNAMAFATEKKDYELNENIGNFMERVDKRMDIFAKNQENTIYHSLESVSTWKDIIKLLGNHSKLTYQANLMVNSKYISGWIDEDPIRVFDTTEENPDAYFTVELNKVMKTIYDKLKTDRYTEDFELISLLELAEEAFDIYKNYQNQYLKTRNKEAAILRKCNKM